MTFQIIIKDKDRHHKFGRTRSEQEENMRKEWGFTMSDEQLDKCRFIERKNKERNGSTKNFVRGHVIDMAGSLTGDKTWADKCTGPLSDFARGHEKIKWNT